MRRHDVSFLKVLTLLLLLCCCCCVMMAQALHSVPRPSTVVVVRGGATMDGPKKKKRKKQTAAVTQSTEDPPLPEQKSRKKKKKRPKGTAIPTHIPKKRRKRKKRQKKKQQHPDSDYHDTSLTVLQSNKEGILSDAIMDVAQEVLGVEEEEKESIPASEPAEETPNNDDSSQIKNGESSQMELEDAEQEVFESFEVAETAPIENQQEMVGTVESKSESHKKKGADVGPVKNEDTFTEDTVEDVTKNESTKLDATIGALLDGSKDDTVATDVENDPPDEMEELGQGGDAGMASTNDGGSNNEESTSKRGDEDHIGSSPVESTLSTEQPADGEDRGVEADNDVFGVSNDIEQVTGQSDGKDVSGDETEESDDEDEGPDENVESTESAALPDDKTRSTHSRASDSPLGDDAEHEESKSSAVVLDEPEDEKVADIEVEEEEAGSANGNHVEEEIETSESEMPNGTPSIESDENEDKESTASAEEHDNDEFEAPKDDKQSGSKDEHEEHEDVPNGLAVDEHPDAAESLNVLDESSSDQQSPTDPTVDWKTLKQSRDEPSDLLVSVVTWNLAEDSPSEEDAAFIKRFREAQSDFVLISGQECENIKPRRTEGRRSREYRRLMIKMLGKKYVPIALHMLGGIQFGLFCKRSILGDVEHASVVDVTCGIGNVFHNKGAIGAFVRLKDSQKRQSMKLLFVTAHMAAHVKNVEARNADFWRIASELEAQAPARFLPPQADTESSSGSYLMNSMDRIFFCGDLNYRLDLPREMAEHAVTESAALRLTHPAQSNSILQDLLRHDQLRTSIAADLAFPGFAEGPIHFPPTFKFDKETNDYDTSHKQRIPAWTDRILFKPFGTRVLEYDSVPTACHSDHRPVFATFRVNRKVAETAANKGKRRRKAIKKKRTKQR